MISFQMFSNPNNEMNIATGFIPINERILTSELAEYYFTSFCWAPFVWKDGHRAERNWLSVNVIGLDFDNGIMSLPQAFDEFGEYWHIIGTTKNHNKSKNGTEPKQRFRVILLLPMTITSGDYYKSIYYTLTQIYPCDPACGDLGRWFAPCTTIESTHLFEHGLNPKLFSIPEIINNSHSQNKKFNRDYERNLLRIGISENRNINCFRLANYFRECGLQPQDAEARIAKLILDWHDFNAKEIFFAVKSAYSGKYGK